MGRLDGEVPGRLRGTAVKVDVIASESHYLRHLMPIWAALPEKMKGLVHPLYAQGQALRPPMGRVALIAGWQDLAPLRGQCNMIYVEHGAGQTYVGREHDPSYSGSGGTRHRGVIGYIAPNEEVAKRWTNAPSVAVGSPKMDRWHPPTPAKPRQRVDNPTICFAWHWPCTLVPEAMTAWEHYALQFGDIIGLYEAQGFRVVAHEHPKWRGKLAARIEAEFNIEILHSDEDVFEQADILAVDNSSLGMEFMSLDRPVLWLNAPWYRRDVQHGGRFWDWTLGLEEINGPDDLLALNLWDTLAWQGENVISPRSAQQHHVARTYGPTDGHASGRAAAFIVDRLDHM